MAHIENLQYKRTEVTVVDAYISSTIVNDGYIWLDVIGNTVGEIYKFIVTGDASVGGTLDCAVYKGSTTDTLVLQYHVTISTPGTDGVTVNGSYTDIIDSIDISVEAVDGDTDVYMEEVIEVVAEVSTSSIETDTILVGDLFETDGSPIYRVYYRDADGYHTVFHEQIPQPIAPEFISKTETSITWKYVSPASSQDSVNVNALISGSTSTVIATLSPGGDVTYTWSGLTSDTSYTTSYYLSAVTATGLKVSEITTSAAVTTYPPEEELL